MSKTRYLPLNAVMLLEYKLLEEASTPDIDFSNDETFYYTKLLDGHYLIFSPNTCEMTFNNSKPEPISAHTGDVKTFNTLNHLAVPTDRKDSLWYTFIDNSYEYCEEDELNSLKYKQYARYFSNPLDPSSNDRVETLKVYSKLRYDTLKLYFVSGYDFSDMLGVVCRISIETRKEGKPLLDLCDFFITKGSAVNMVKYIAEPIIVGAQTYDRYIEIKIPCLYDICVNDDADNIGTPDINKILEIRENAPLHVVISSVEEGDYEMKELYRESSGIGSIVRRSYTKDEKLNRLVNCEFYRSSTLNGAIPTENLISDRLGVYIAENNDLSSIEFCMTWKDSLNRAVPLDFDLVSNFNHGIFLYDRSLIKEYSPYEIDEDYEVDDSVSMHNWVIMHSLKISYCDENNMELRLEEYNMSQTFDRADRPTMFYYKPLLADTGLVEKVASINIEYFARLMNIRDLVQFVDAGSLVITENLNRFYINSVHTSYTDLVPFKIYNKIIENKHEIVKTGTIVPKVKYVKVFYDSTDIVLEGNSGTYYTSDNIAVQLSQAPKNYKFVLKNRKSDGVYDYMDLSDGYYKLYTKNASGDEIIIEPTYSSNMNMLLGELEFTITKSIINSLQAVDPAERKMSLIVQNEDNSISSLFDFMYEF